jgi:tetratricopeptide (TPR) repeat protein
MSLINEALKKAAKDSQPDDSPDSAYPQKLLFIAAGPASNRSWLVTLGGLAVIVGVAVVAWQQPATRQLVIDLVGLGGAPAPRTVQPPATPAPERATPASPPPIDRLLVERQLETGIAAYRNRELKQARPAFVAALALDPASAVAHNGLGLVDKAEGRLPEAERHYQEAVRLFPDYAEAHNNLALLYDQRGDTDRAIVEYNTALTLRPNYPDARLNYAIALERAGRRVEAKQQYQRFLADAPPDLADVAGKVKAHMATFS